MSLVGPCIFFLRTYRPKTEDCDGVGASPREKLKPDPSGARALTYFRPLLLPHARDSFGLARKIGEFIGGVVLRFNEARTFAGALFVFCFVGVVLFCFVLFFFLPAFLHSLISFPFCVSSL